MNYNKSRPLRVYVAFVDPFDETPICTLNLPWRRRLSALGFYSRHIIHVAKNCHKFDGGTLEGRIPITRTTLIFPRE